MRENWLRFISQHALLQKTNLYNVIHRVWSLCKDTFDKTECKHVHTRTLWERASVSRFFSNSDKQKNTHPSFPQLQIPNKAKFFIKASRQIEQKSLSQDFISNQYAVLCKSCYYLSSCYCMFQVEKCICCCCCCYQSPTYFWLLHVQLMWSWVHFAVVISLGHLRLSVFLLSLWSTNTNIILCQGKKLLSGWLWQLAWCYPGGQCFCDGVQLYSLSQSHC